MRSRRQRIRLLALLAGLVLLAGVGTGFAASMSSGPGTSRVSRPFTVSGSVESLVPGQTSRLRLTVRNTTDRRRIKVVSITVTPADAGPGCEARHLRVGSFTGALRLRRNESRTVTVPVTLSSGAPDACQGATFPLAFGGRAVKP